MRNIKIKYPRDELNEEEIYYPHQFQKIMEFGIGCMLLFLIFSVFIPWLINT